MDHSVVSGIVLFAGAGTAILLFLVTLVALEVRQLISSRAVRLLVIASIVALYVISPLAFDAVVLFLVQRKGIDYTAVDPAWWVELAPSLFAIVAAILFQLLRRRRRSVSLRI